MAATSIVYAIPYLIFGLWFLVLAYYENILRRTNCNIIPIKIFAVISFLFFFGFRGHIMTDFMGYYDWFYQVPSLFDSNLNTLFDGIAGEAPREAGFMVYTCLVKTIYSNYFFWVFVNAVITITVLNYFFDRYSSQYALSFLFFLAFLGLGMEINTYRNVKSIALFLLSIPYIEQRKPIKYLFVNGIGVLFHASSVFYLPIYWILRKQLSVKFIWTIFLLCNIIFIFHISFIRPILNVVGSILGGRIEHLVHVYTSIQFDTNYSFSVGFFERNITFIIIAIMYKKLILKRSNIIFCNLFFLYFITFFCFSEIKVISDRVPMLFICSYWILYPQIISCFRLLSNKMIFINFIILLAMLKILTGTNNILCRYDNLLLGEIESFESRVSIYDNIGYNVVK